MAMPIFWRLILGTMGILFLSVAACLYTIIQLGTLSQTVRTALDSDQRMIGYQEALTDAFLSEVRYGGKFIFTPTKDRYEQSLQFKNDFSRYLSQMKSLPHSDEVAASLARIEQFHRQYHELFDREVVYIRARQSYAQSRFQQERDKVFESELGELERLKTLLQANLHEKLQGIDHAARNARQIGILTTLIVGILGTLFSLKISRTIAAPLKQLEAANAVEFVAADLPRAGDQREDNLLLSAATQITRRLTVLAGNTWSTWSRYLGLAKNLATRKGD